LTSDNSFVTPSRLLRDSFEILFKHILMKNCIIIGISDSRNQWFEPKVLEAIKAGKVFSGGKRHHEIMNDFLPQDAVWIDITVPLSTVFEQYKAHDDIVIFASGDPLFFGFAATVQREVPECDIKVFPYFNSLQMLAHRMCLPYQDMHVVSLTGRPWDKFDEALINGEQLIGCLTDKNKTPEAIWQRMQEFGYDNYEMTIGECLGNEDERIYSPLTPEGGSLRTEAIHNNSIEKPIKGSDPLIGEFDRNNKTGPRTPEAALFGGRGTRNPNCLILRKTFSKPRYFGIPESDFELLDGRAKMITKAPIRLMSLSALELQNRRTFWDVGFCTGSVSIEAKLQFPHLHIESFEIRTECEDIINKNMRRFGAPGINVHIGDFLEADLTGIPVPDAVFIGGHGGKLLEIMEKIISHSKANAKEAEPVHGIRFVINSVSDKSRNLMYEAAEKLKLTKISDNRIVLDEHNPINIITFAE